MEPAMKPAGMLLDIARYLRAHPDAWKNVNTPSALAPLEHRHEVVATLRRELKLKDEFGSLCAWSKGKPCAQVIRELERIAKKLLNS